MNKQRARIHKTEGLKKETDKETLDNSKNNNLIV